MYLLPLSNVGAIKSDVVKHEGNDDNEQQDHPDIVISSFASFLSGIVSGLIVVVEASESNQSSAQNTEQAKVGQVKIVLAVHLSQDTTALNIEAVGGVVVLVFPSSNSFIFRAVRSRKVLDGAAVVLQVELVGGVQVVIALGFSEIGVNSLGVTVGHSSVGEEDDNEKKEDNAVNEENGSPSLVASNESQSRENSGDNAQSIQGLGSGGGEEFSQVNIIVLAIKSSNVVSSEDHV